MSTPRRHFAWFVCLVVASFLVPFVLADRLELQKDVYYGLYGLGAVGLFVAWARNTGQSIPEMLFRHRTLAIGLGLLFAGFSVLIAVNAEDSGPTADGAQFVGELVWRGLFYGAIDGLVLSAFPILLVFAALADTRLRARRYGVVAVGALAMSASLLITATYHLGYEDFRSDKVRKPITGDLVWSVPTLVTLNPVGAPMAHAGLHVAAVSHNSETDLFLPPH